MRAERVILETDDSGDLAGLPRFRPHAHIEAIFLDLDSAPPRPSASAAADPRAVVEILARIGSLANLPEGDTFSGEDHDQVLYGEGGAQ